MSKEIPTMTLATGMDAETFADLERLHDRMDSAGICTTAQAMVGTAIVSMIQKFGGAETSAILDQWVHTLDAMDTNVCVHGEPQPRASKPARKRRKV